MLDAIVDVFIRWITSFCFGIHIIFVLALVCLCGHWWASDCAFSLLGLCGHVIDFAWTFLGFRSHWGALACLIGSLLGLCGAFDCLIGACID